VRVARAPGVRRGAERHGHGVRHAIREVDDRGERAGLEVAHPEAHGDQVLEVRRREAGIDPEDAAQDAQRDDRQVARAGDGDAAQVGDDPAARGVRERDRGPARHRQDGGVAGGRDAGAERRALAEVADRAGDTRGGGVDAVLADVARAGGW